MRKVRMKKDAQNLTRDDTQKSSCTTIPVKVVNELKFSKAKIDLSERETKCPHTLDLLNKPKIAVI